MDPRPVDPLRRFSSWSRKTGLSRKVAFAFAGAAAVSGVATLVSMAGTGPEAMNPKVVLILLYLDVILLLGLGAIIARRLMTIWLERRKGVAGSKLHTRFLLMFSLVAVTPSIIVAVFAGLFLNFGIQAWFSDKVFTAVMESREVVRAYLHEHRKAIKADVLAVAADINNNAPRLMQSSYEMSRFLDTVGAIRTVPELVVLDRGGKILARSSLSFSLEFDQVPLEALDKAQSGDVVILTGENEDRVRAITRLDRFVDSYLLVGRFVDPKVFEHIEKTEGAVKRYKDIEEKREGIQITFVMIFALVAILLLLVAGWFGLVMANRLAAPIGQLISASERIRKGDMSARVSLLEGGDEIDTLNRAFNRMTSQLETQRKGLVDANRELDERRRFTETVLSGVSAGVIGLDREGLIHLPNRSACALLATGLEDLEGKPFGEAVPEMRDLLLNVMRRPERSAQGEISLIRGEKKMILLTRIAAELMEREVLGYVVTFDDITELQSAQRTAAWADVARRIAHEIKNPLTPIQLSAERLKRKYLDRIEEDKETFELCTQTIVRHVEDIGRMVDEFSSFARMPQPVLAPTNLKQLCRETVFLEKNRNSDIEFRADVPEEDVIVLCDEKQIGRALTNLLKNAAESLGAVERDGGRFVALTLTTEPDVVTVHIEDNGPGFPKDLRGRLTEPYVTTREKGTGLGLAIVKKIMEEHDGDLILDDREGGGATVTLVFPHVDRDSQGVENSGDSASAGSREEPMDMAIKLTTDGL